MKIVSSKNRYSKVIKPFLQKLYFHQRTENRLLILGCQRSGTTLLSKLFDEVFSCAVYGEYSAFSNQDTYRLRLNDLSSVVEALENIKIPTVILKPLVESQNANVLLESIPQSSVIWMYRNPFEVASSSINKFGIHEGAINKIRPLYDSEFAKNPWTTWLTEKVNPEHIEHFRPYFDLAMNPNDAAMIFWYLRNVQYFENSLQGNERVMLLNYEQLLLHGKEISAKISRFLGRKIDLNVAKVERQTAALELNVDSAIQSKCFELYERFKSIENNENIVSPQNRL